MTMAFPASDEASEWFAAGYVSEVGSDENLLIASILPWSRAVSGLRAWRHPTTSNVERGSQISYVFNASLAGKVRSA
jgi:hypothetical protein